MRVCHVSRFACPRMLKLAWAQLRAKHPQKQIAPFWIGERLGYQKTNPFISMEFSDEDRFGGYMRAVRKFEKEVDLFHVHTHIMDGKILSDIRGLTEKPVIWDAHDEPMHMKIGKAHLGAVERLGKTVYRTFCPKGWFVHPKPAINELVMASGLSDKPGTFRYWYDALETIKRSGHDVTCFTFSEVPVYENVAKIVKNIDVRNLIATMANYEAGLCGTLHPDENIKTAEPNKLYEYMAAGIPAICIGSDLYMAKLIRDMGIGVVIDDPKDISKAILEIQKRDYRANVVRIRKYYTMEKEADKVTKVYEKALKA